MPLLGTHSSVEIARFVEAAGESANIDAKGPIEWDGGEASASLAKDILALANSRDGGVIVIGKEEPQAGKFVLSGVSDVQASSFETTKVATWVNNHCSPPVNLVCYRHEHEGMTCIVITVAEFDDVPVICTKQFEIAGKPPRVLLRKGTVYLRTPNAESAPLSTVEEMRSLIGLATTKRADQMLAMFQAMMQGRPLLAEKPHEELFQTEKEEVRTALDSELGGQLEKGAWTFLCNPIKHLPNRWEESDKLKAILNNCVVRVRQEFPPISHDPHVREWGICNRHHEDAFGLTYSGLFMSARSFRENTVAFNHPWQPVSGQRHPGIGPGQWLDFKLNLALVIEFFMFISRFAENFDAGEELMVEVVADQIAGRTLASMDGNINLEPTEPCRASVFRRKKTVSAESLRAGWEEQCTWTLQGFFEMFSGARISKETLMMWVEKFKARKF